MRKPLLSDFGLTEQILEKHEATYVDFDVQNETI